MMLHGVEPGDAAVSSDVEALPIRDRERRRRRFDLQVGSVGRKYERNRRNSRQQRHSQMGIPHFILAYFVAGAQCSVRARGIYL
jgi:hypothetical protein